MLFILGCLLLLGFLIVRQLRSFQDRRTPHFGWMSERWIAEYRASQQA